MADNGGMVGFERLHEAGFWPAMAVLGFAFFALGCGALVFYLLRLAFA
jgi:hypothetical protein